MLQCGKFCFNAEDFPVPIDIYKVELARVHVYKPVWSKFKTIKSDSFRFLDSGVLEIEVRIFRKRLSAMWEPLMSILNCGARGRKEACASDTPVLLGATGTIIRWFAKANLFSGLVRSETPELAPLTQKAFINIIRRNSRVVCDIEFTLAQNSYLSGSGS